MTPWIPASRIEGMHYMNGRKARVGDMVVGTTYNTQHPVAGTLLSITPGPDVCSAKVGFLSLELVAPVREVKPGLFCGNDRAVAVQGTENHGNTGPLAATLYREDYTEAKRLLHVEDAVLVCRDSVEFTPPIAVAA